jgi:hypothetical protein
VLIVNNTPCLAPLIVALKDSNYYKVVKGTISSAVFSKLHLLQS